MAPENMESHVELSRDAEDRILAAEAAAATPSADDRVDPLTVDADVSTVWRRNSTGEKNARTLYTSIVAANIAAKPSVEDW